ncbi:MAG TPA: sugar phosphate isomerase/epimerase family protein [bacterium]|nr:sugar phosphate isomerase/epimerase family protein [bacterium]HPP30392.1 sugar phosphate isomerase/epimerase family protein [bacterium]
MKFSFMSFTTPDKSLKEMIDIAKKYGYDGIEPRAQEKHKHGIEIDTLPEERKEIRRIFEGEGIECACIATSIRYCFTDETQREKEIELTKKFIDLAADIGCKRIRVFGGVPDRVITYEEAIKIVADALSKVKDYAETFKVYVCLETHDFFSRADIAAAPVKKVNSPFIKINWDIMHPFTKLMTIEEAFTELKGLIEHCHIHDGTYDKARVPKLALMGEGEIPYNIAVRLLKNSGYRGYLSGEYINAWPPEVVLPHDIEVLKSYM